MKWLHIIVEGETEENFTKNILFPYFTDLNINQYSVSLVTTSKNHKGGMTNYEHIKKDILKFLKQRDDYIITTFIDFFRLPSNFPGYNSAQKLSSNRDKNNYLIKEFYNDINDDRFIPYIQLHEFEALLFSSITGFEEYFNDVKILKKITEIINEFSSPEDINDNPNTAPSKRLLQIIPNYNKVVYGDLIAKTNGIDVIIEKCNGFKCWINEIINKFKTI